MIALAELVGLPASLLRVLLVRASQVEGVRRVVAERLLIEILHVGPFLLEFLLFLRGGFGFFGEVGRDCCPVEVFGLLV